MTAAIAACEEHVWRVSTFTPSKPGGAEGTINYSCRRCPATRTDEVTPHTLHTKKGPADSALNAMEER